MMKQIISITLRRHVSAVNIYHQAKLEQRSGTRIVCTLLPILIDICKAIPLQAWTGTGGSSSLRLSDFKIIDT